MEKENNPWYRPPEMPGWCYNMIKEARFHNCWIYSKRTKDFYTPDEFENKWKAHCTTDRRNADLSEEYCIKFPHVAIRQRAEWVRKASAELDAIMKKYEEFIKE